MRRLIIFILCSSIRMYQFFISPLLPKACRFTPSCSNYFFQVLKKYGIRRGFFLGISRILKCHPFHPGGIDPIP